MRYSGWDGNYQFDTKPARDYFKFRRTDLDEKAPLVQVLEEIRDILTPTIGVGPDTAELVVKYIDEVLKEYL